MRFLEVNCFDLPGVFMNILIHFAMHNRCINNGRMYEMFLSVMTMNSVYKKKNILGRYS